MITFGSVGMTITAKNLTTGLDKVPKLLLPLLRLAQKHDLRPLNSNELTVLLLHKDPLLLVVF